MSKATRTHPLPYKLTLNGRSPREKLTRIVRVNRKAFGGDKSSSLQLGLNMGLDVFAYPLIIVATRQALEKNPLTIRVVADGFTCQSRVFFEKEGFWQVKSSFQNRTKRIFGGTISGAFQLSPEAIDQGCSPLQSYCFFQHVQSSPKPYVLNSA